MVPIRLGVPDKVAIQPGFQPWPSNLSYLGWWQEAKMRLVQAGEVHKHRLGEELAPGLL
uniref:Uncharacterized protein n=1 Tax=Arundo donax TaxID=35708 RepID=A0A0A8Z021_ARUDO